MNGVDGGRININPNLSHKLQDLAFAKIRPYKLMFFQHPFNCAVADVEPIRLKLLDQKIVCKPDTRFPKRLRQIVQRKLDNLGEKEIVQEQQSPYKSQVVVVEKPDGGYKMFANYKAINEKIVQISVTPPKPQQIWPLLRNKKYFAVIDLNSGLFQIPLSEESKAITGISLYGKDYVYNALPPGMRYNKNGYLQKIMTKLFRDMVASQKIVIYLGTICIPGETFVEVVDNTVAVLKRLDKRNFKLRTNNCKFFFESVDFLGYTISHNQLQPSEKNLNNIRNSKLPQNSTELRQFIGRVNFYRHMIEGYAKFEAALGDLLVNCSNDHLNWTEEKKKCFSDLKQRILDKPTLAIVDPAAAKLLVMKVYSRAVEGVLYQNDIGPGQLVEYFSKKLKTDKKKWTAIHLELFAISISCEHFSIYLAEPAGHKIIIQTKYLSHGVLKCLRMESAVLEKLASTFDHLNYEIQLVDNVAINAIINDVDYGSDLGYTSTEE